MNPRGNEELGLEHIVFFSDAVMAIASTLPVRNAVRLTVRDVLAYE
jgi:hypothetical protein